MSRAGALAVLQLAAVPAAGVTPDARDSLPPPGSLALACAGVATNPVGGLARATTATHSARKPGSDSRNAMSRDLRGANDSGADVDGEATMPHPPVDRTGRGIPVEFRFEFTGGHGRVLYPAAIVPVMHSGGDRDGWWPVRDLVVSDDAFSGRVVLNFINHARFTIDRRSGLFNLTGLQANATGRCAKAESGPRLF